MTLLKKGSKLFSILKMKCPRCHVGDLFETGTFSFQKSFHMPPNCNKCGQRYYLEPGFYYGSMFISYLLTGFFSLAFVGTLFVFFDWSINGSFALLILILAIFYVWIFRISRAIWINIHVKYDPTVRIGEFKQKKSAFVNRNF